MKNLLRRWLLATNFHQRLGRVLGSVVAVVVLFWLALPAEFKVNEASDYEVFYAPVARNLLAGRGLTLDGAPATRYPPGFPVLLSGIFALAHMTGIPENTLISLFTLCCIGLAAVLLFVIADRVWKSPRALVVPLAWVCYPMLLWLTKQPNSEVPFIAALYLTVAGIVLACSRPRGKVFWYFGAGAAAGLAMLIRPAAVGLLLVLPFIVWFAERTQSGRLRSRIVAMLLGGMLIVVAPWEVWVYAKTHRVILLSTGSVSSIRDGLTFSTSKGYRQSIAMPSDVEAVTRDFRARYPELSSLPRIAKEVLAECRRQPGVMAKLLLIKASRAWYGLDSGRHETAVLAVQIPWLAILLLASAKAWRRRGTERRLTILVWTFVCYFWMMTVFVLAIVRYMAPAIGLLFLLLPALLPAPRKQRIESAIPSQASDEVGKTEVTIV